jgi:hypothetical protein
MILQQRNLLLLLPCCWATEPNQTLSPDQPMWQPLSPDQLRQASLKTSQELQDEDLLNHTMPEDLPIPSVNQLIFPTTWLDQLTVPPYFVDQLKAVNILLETYLTNKVTFN